MILQQEIEELYHKSIGFPSGTKVPLIIENLEYSLHAKNAARNDTYGNIVLPESVHVTKENVIEIGLTRKILSKIVLRLSYDAQRDMIMVIIPSRRFVKTVWLNLKSDTHRTLDKARYKIPK